MFTHAPIPTSRIYTSLTSSALLFILREQLRDSSGFIFASQSFFIFFAVVCFFLKSSFTFLPSPRIALRKRISAHSFVPSLTSDICFAFLTSSFCYLTTLTISRLYGVGDRMINEYGKFIRMIVGRGNLSTLRKPTCPPQIPHGLACDRTRAAARWKPATSRLSYDTAVHRLGLRESIGFIRYT